MGQDPSAIREDIEATRDHMGETADALVAKVEGPAGAKQRLLTARDEVKDRATATANDLVGRVRQYASHPDQAAERAKDQVRRAGTEMRENPRSVTSGAGTVAVLVAAFMAMAVRARRRQSGVSGTSTWPSRRYAAASQLERLAVSRRGRAALSRRRPVGASRRGRVARQGRRVTRARR